MSTIDCLTAAVGLANCACPCDAETAPEGWEAGGSPSGLYIADLVPLNTIGSADDCTTPGNPWAALARFRTQAATVFRSDLATGLNRKNKDKRAKFSGGIGEVASREVVALAKDYAGLRLHFAHVPHGTCTVTKIGGVFNASGTINVYVYDRYNTELGGPYAITTVAGQHREHTLATPLNLPTYTAFGEPAEYFLAYEKNAANLPRANRTMCPTCKGEADVFNLGLETWPKYGGNLPAWTGWLMAGGFESDDLASFDIIAAEQSVTTSITNGLTVTLSLECDKTRFICNGTFDGDDPLQLVAAHAVYYLAASLAIDAKLISNTADRSNLVNRDEWREKKVQYRTEYENRVDYIADQAKPHEWGCLECKPPVNIRTSGILS